MIENAKKLGIPNATHNNTRGFITRTLEHRLIAAANGIQPYTSKLDELLNTNQPGVLNRVINLETGSLAVEAALKMMLARFYSLEEKQADYEGCIPVFLVMADNAGGITVIIMEQPYLHKLFGDYGQIFSKRHRTMRSTASKVSLLMT